MLAASEYSESDLLQSAARAHMAVVKELAETQLQRQASGLQTNMRKADDTLAAQRVVSHHRAAPEAMLAPETVGSELTVEKLLAVHARLPAGDSTRAGVLRHASHALCGATQSRV